MIRRLVILSIVLFVGVAHSHQQKETYTTVLFNERTGNLEISHRFYIHDAEHALAKEIKANADLHNDEETRKLFTHYVSQNFSLKDSNNKLLVLTSVGSEVDGKYFWVYQEAPITTEMNKFNVSMSTLQDVWPEQINQINFERNKIVKSIRLTLTDEWTEISLTE